MQGDHMQGDLMQGGHMQGEPLQGDHMQGNCQSRRDGAIYHRPKVRASLGVSVDIPPVLIHQHLVVHLGLHCFLNQVSHL